MAVQPIIALRVFRACLSMNPSTQATLVEHLLAHPNDDDAWAVYGDLLSAEGDPRGEIIALSLSVEPDAEARVAELIKEHEPTWFPKVARVRRFTRREYEYGFLRAFTMPQGRVNLSTTLLRDVLTSSASRFLRTLNVQLAGFPLPFVVDVIAAAPPRGLRDLKLGIFPDHDAPEREEQPEPHPLLASLPHLTSLTLDVTQGELALSHDALETLLVMEHGENFDVHLGRASLPKLAHLAIKRFDHVPFRARALAPMLRQAPALRRLEVWNVADTAGFIESLIEHEVLAQLSELSVVRGDLTDDGAQLLLDHVAIARQVEHINVERNFLSDAMFERLARAGIRTMGAQRARE